MLRSQEQVCFFIKSLAFKIFGATAILGTYLWCRSETYAHPPLPTLSVKRERDRASILGAVIQISHGLRHRFWRRFSSLHRQLVQQVCNKARARVPFNALLWKRCKRKALQPPLGGHGRVGSLCVRSHPYTSATISNEALTSRGAALWAP